MTTITKLKLSIKTATINDISRFKLSVQVARFKDIPMTDILKLELSVNPISTSGGWVFSTP